MHRIRTWSRTRRLLVVLLVIAAAEIAFMGVQAYLHPKRTTLVYSPRVIAGQQLAGWCAGGFYARQGDSIVVTSAGHCAPAGTVVNADDGSGPIGVFGPKAFMATCPHPDHECVASDIAAVVLEPSRIPWGHLNEVDMGVGGYRVLAAGTKPLACGDIQAGDLVEIDGRQEFRTGKVLDKGEYLHAEDGSYFPCIVAASISAGSGDSGGAVLVNGVPAGATTRELGGKLGFTPLAEGLEALGLVLCTTPNCDLTPPGASPSATP